MAKRYTAGRSIRLDLTGLEEAAKRIANAGGSVDAAVKMAIHESAEPIRAEIEAWAEKHKLTGTMLKGVDLSEPVQSGNEISVTVGINDDKSPGAWHATFVEYGTPTQPADPGIRLAFDRNRSKVKSIQRKVLIREGLPLE
ncbi:HK97-gp10 family putative phage morphogenesis protein [Paenibacillus sp. HJGM_3]|uniref:HK97-gp10 family putative phage morphogenesis protein n=1 Tax=Paenibacillus sp. HJGM_3 TaxID=3379816 RepID=UPI00385E93C6